MGENKQKSLLGKQVKVNLDWIRELRARRVVVTIIAEYPFHYLCERETEFGTFWRFSINKADMVTTDER